MKRLLDLFFLGVLTLISVASCNIYSPFATATTDESRIEKARSCIAAEDFDCAIENFEALGDATLKYLHLCQTHLTRAGLTLEVLVTTFGSSSGGSSTAMGKIANNLAPWDATKQDSAEKSVANCASYKDAVATHSEDKEYGNDVHLLSAFVDCAIRIAKTDLFVATDNADTECKTAGNEDGIINAADVTQDAALGTITAGTPGMCAADVTKCQSDFSVVSPETGKQMSDFLDSIPAALKTDGMETDLTRKSISEAVGS